jgi:hypothetical protein
MSTIIQFPRADGIACPRCGRKAQVVGGFNAIDYIECAACGWYGDHWTDENGATHDAEVPAENGFRKLPR